MARDFLASVVTVPFAVFNLEACEGFAPRRMMDPRGKAQVDMVRFVTVENALGFGADLLGRLQDLWEAAVHARFVAPVQ